MSSHASSRQASPSNATALYEALERPPSARRLGLYVHLPFCRVHCTYCAFAISTDLTREHAYVDALISTRIKKGDEAVRELVTAGFRARRLVDQYAVAPDRGRETDAALMRDDHRLVPHAAPCRW